MENKDMETLLEQEMISYFTQLNEDEKKSFIQILKMFLDNEEERFESVTIDQYNREIDQAMERVRQGDYITMEDLKKEMGSW